MPTYEQRKELFANEPVTSTIWLNDEDYEAFRASLRSNESIYPLPRKELTHSQRTILAQEQNIGWWYRTVID
jgi:hypothetical protein